MKYKKHSSLVTFIIITLLYSRINAQTCNTKIIILEDYISIEKTDTSSNNIADFNPIRLPYCNEIGILIENKGFFLYNDSIVDIIEDSGSEKSIVMTIYSGKTSFSNNGDNIKVDIIRNNHMRIFMKAFASKEKLQDDLSEKIYEILFINSTNKKEQLIFKETYYVRINESIYRVTETFKFCDMITVPFLGKQIDYCNHEILI